MLLLDLGTLQFGSELKMGERLKKYYERKKKGMDMFLQPNVVQELKEYELTIKPDEFGQSPVLSNKEVFDDNDKELSIFYNKFSLHVLALQALMLRTNLDYQAVRFLSYQPWESEFCELPFFFVRSLVCLPAKYLETTDLFRDSISTLTLRFVN
jgi:hypothetical protein